MQQVVRKFTQEEVIPKAAYYDQTGEVHNDALYSLWLVNISYSVKIPILVVDTHISKTGTLASFVYLQEYSYFGSLIACVCGNCY